MGSGHYKERGLELANGSLNGECEHRERSRHGSDCVRHVENNVSCGQEAFQESAA